MISIDRFSRVPVYEQIYNQIITLIHLGVFEENTKLPSIRQVSSDTSVNVNTVKKAFSLLEASGAIYTVPGTGSFVSENALENASVTSKALESLQEGIEHAKSVGVKPEEIEKLIRSVYKEGEN